MRKLGLFLEVFVTTLLLVSCAHNAAVNTTAVETVPSIGEMSSTPAQAECEKAFARIVDGNPDGVTVGRRKRR